MKYEHLMKEADWNELAEIERMTGEAKARRKRLMTRLRQRALRQRRA